MTGMGMQTRLGNHHHSLKEFPKGNPIRECFWKQVHKDRIEKHLSFLLDEHMSKEKLSLEDESIKSILESNFKKFSSELRKRGYQLL